MSLTRRVETIMHRLAADGTLEVTEVTFYVKQDVDDQNPAYEPREHQAHLVINHLEAGASDPPAPGNGRRTAGDLTPTQRTGIQAGITNTMNALARTIPINPGPSS